MKYSPSQIRKAIVAVIGALLVAIVQFTPLIPDGSEATVTQVITVLTAVGVFLTKNATLIDSADRFLD